MENITPLNTCAVIVSYEPDVTVLLKLLKQLNEEVDFVLVDNGSTAVDQFSTLILELERCKKIIRLDTNEGLAVALNAGIKWVQGANYAAAILFDQDSGLCQHFVNKITLAYMEASELSKHKLALVGPRLLNPESGKTSKFKVFNRVFFRSDRPFFSSKRLFHADFLITSGSLIPLANLADIGLMKESYFIDNIDLEWCFRAKSKGFDIIGTDQATLFHMIGETSDDPLVKAGLIVQHKPQRSYYTSRNRLHLYRVKYSPLGWKLRDMIRFTVKSCWLLISSPQRKEYLKNILAGMRDSKKLK